MTPEPLPPLCEAVINFEGQAPIPCNLPADHPGHCEFGSDESMRYQTAALDGLASNGPAQAYTMGYEAGRAEALDETTAVELIADGYTAAQEARADAIAAASHVLAAAVQSGGLIVIQEGDGILGLGAALVKMAREPATWIEHGDQPTVAEHVEDAIGLVGSARAVVADALGTIKGNPDLGHRVDQALDAAKMAQPRARPTQT